MGLRSAVEVGAKVLLLMVISTWTAAAAHAAAAPRDPATRAASPPAAVVVSLTAHPHRLDDRPGPILVRELIRQAVLIAARDELGASTRDQALREPLGGAGVVKLDIQTRAAAPLRLRVAGEQGQVLFDGILNAPKPYAAIDLPAIAAAAEKHSRQEFVALLRKAGVKDAQQNPAKADAPAPLAAEEYLSRLDLLWQFAALREAHEQIRAEGESPARLGVLVRAYANLGQLTAFHWNSVHKTFKARALLYGQRMAAATDEKSPLALWHRAYARSLAGLHAAALADLKQAQQLASTAPAGAADARPPQWVTLIEPLCRYQAGTLAQLAAENEKVAPLAIFFAFLTVEHSRCQGAEMSFSQAAFELNPTCLRLIDYMCTHTGPGMLNALTELGPATFSQSLGRDLPELPGLPEQIRQQIADLRRPGGNPQARLVITRALLEQGGGARDGGEPSWAALARLIEDVTFVHTWRWADLIANRWDVDASDYVAEALPLLADHPYRAYIQSFADKHAAPAERAALLRDLKLTDVDLQVRPLINVLSAAGIRNDAAGRPLWRQTYDHADFIAGDEERILKNYADAEPSNYKSTHINRLLRVSPHAPLGMALLIQDDWAKAEPLVDKWLKQRADHPTLTKALALKYRRLGRYDEAERMWKRYIAVSPDRAGYNSLAYLYKLQGKMDQWLATKKAFLEQPDYGLQHAGVRVNIANYYMSRGDFGRAIEYAEAAAETGAAWAYLCAADAHAGAGNWERAEDLVKEAAAHYDDPLDWFSWCVRTGRGDRAAARAAVEQRIDALRGRDPFKLAHQQARFHLLAGEPKAAVAPLKEMLENHNSVWAGMHLALVHHAAGDAKTRDAALGRVIAIGIDKNKFNAFHNRTVALATLVRDALARPTPKLDEAAAEKILQELDLDDREQLDYLLARWLESFGQTDAAQRHLARSASSTSPGRTDIALAWVRLRETGTEPLKLPRNIDEPQGTGDEPTTRPAAGTVTGDSGGGGGAAAGSSGNSTRGEGEGAAPK